MHSIYHQRGKKIVPRFRRKNLKNNLVDIDDEEANALIEKDLQSHFVWTSDTTENLQYHFDNEQNPEDNQNIFIDEDFNRNSAYDIENSNEQLWKYNVESNDKQFIQWTHDQQQDEIKFSIQSNQDKQQQWSLNDNKQLFIQLNLINQNDQINNYDLQQSNNQQISSFIQGEQFINNRIFSIEANNEKFNVFPNDSEDHRVTIFDSNIESIKIKLSHPQAPINRKWIEGTSEYTLSIPVQSISQQYSPLNKTIYEIDLDTLNSLKWSLDLLKENVRFSYSISLPDIKQNQYSIPDKFHMKLSIDEQNKQQLFTLTDYLLKQKLSISTNDIQQRLLSIIDIIKKEQHFGKDDQNQFYQWNLQDLKTIILNISPEEIINLLYSPADAKDIQLEQIIVGSDEISARAFRRYRCKHMSIKYEDKDCLDTQQDYYLTFQGNEDIAIGEQQIQNDFDEPQIYQDLTDSGILLDNDINQIYDIDESQTCPNNIGPCLYRSDYECNPPKTWPRFRREIGHISYDASYHQPVYHLNKSFKRYIHIPKDPKKCSFNVYQGYSEFIEKVSLNPENYFRRFDALDLRPLLSWYSQKQSLFSLTQKDLLKPPTFICRRLVLRTILANLYCDSDPWKLLVIRIKGQYYLALANKATKSVEDMTKDEFSGYNFESLLTTDQPNTTRFKQNIPLEHPQQQFHTVQYWQFGHFNLLYTNEIDGEVLVDTKTNSSTNENNQNNEQQNEQTNRFPSTENQTNNNDQQEDKQTIQLPSTDNKTNEIDQQEEEQTNELTLNDNWTSLQGEMDTWGDEKPSIVECPTEIIEDLVKQAQINENLQLITNDENETVEKKKRNQFELKSGYAELKCTNRKIFYRDENKLQTLQWWAQMWLANIDTLIIGCKSPDNGVVQQLDLLSIHQLIAVFLSKYDLHLKYCLSYLYSFLKLIQKTVNIDDPNTIHAFAYIPQPLEIDPLTGKPLQVDLPKSVPFRYTQIRRSNTRHSTFMPQWYLEEIQRSIPIQTDSKNNQPKTVEQETKKRIGHRGRSSCLLKQQQQQQQRRQRQNKRKTKKK